LGRVALLLFRCFGKTAGDTRRTTAKPHDHFQRQALDVIVIVHSRIAYGLALKLGLTAMSGDFLVRADRSPHDSDGAPGTPR
jgi:hypothetical protein